MKYLRLFLLIAVVFATSVNSVLPMEHNGNQEKTPSLCALCKSSVDSSDSTATPRPCHQTCLTSFLAVIEHVDLNQAVSDIPSFLEQISDLIAQQRTRQEEDDLESNTPEKKLETASSDAQMQEQISYQPLRSPQRELFRSIAPKLLVQLEHVERQNFSFDPINATRWSTPHTITTVLQKKQSSRLTTVVRNMFSQKVILRGIAQSLAKHFELYQSDQ